MWDQAEAAGRVQWARHLARLPKKPFQKVDLIAGGRWSKTHDYVLLYSIVHYLYTMHCTALQCNALHCSVCVVFCSTLLACTWVLFSVGYCSAGFTCSGCQMQLRLSFTSCGGACCGSTISSMLRICTLPLSCTR